MTFNFHHFSYRFTKPNCAVIMDGACSKVNDGQSDRIMQNNFVSVVSAHQAFSEHFS